MIKRPIRQLLLPLCLLGLCVSFAQEIDVQGLAAKLAPAFANSGKRTVAVVDFVDLNGNQTQFGRYLAEELSVALFGLVNHIEVVDRAHVKTILTEHKLAEKGLVDPVTVRQAASLVGADLLVTGTLTPLGGTVHISAKVLSAESGRIIGAASIDLPKTKRIDDMLAASGTGEPPSQPGAEPYSNMQISSDEGRQGKKGSPRVELGALPQSTNVRDFEFGLKVCSLARGVVTCALQIKSLGSDHSLRICVGCSGRPNSPRIVDDQGREYVATRVQLGNRTADTGYEVRADFAEDVPMAASIKFEGVPQESATITLLEFSCASETAGGRGGGDFKPQFRNIAIKK